SGSTSWPGERAHGRGGHAASHPGRSRNLAPPADGQDVDPLLAEALDQLVVGRRLDHTIELAAVGRHEAHPVDEDVVDLPAAIDLVHAVIEGGVGPPAGDDAGAHRRVAAIHDLAGIDDLLTGVRFDLADVRPLEEV